VKTEENTQNEEVKSQEENGGPGVTGEKLRTDPAHGVGRPSWSLTIFLRVFFTEKI
jgi:hypothetical protein